MSIDKNNYDAVCFIPHSLKRSVQLMNHLEKKWEIPLKKIELMKFYEGPVIVPQKSLKWTKQRVRNARETIVLKPNQIPAKKVLLIDDFVWSGATLNESAKKIKEAGLAKEVVGLALLGNVDLSYDVISEV